MSSPLVRVMCFIDVANLYNGLTTDFGGHRINFGRLFTGIAAGRLLVQAHFYAVPNAHNQGFLAALSQNPLMIIRPGQQGVDGKEKLVDTRLSNDMVRLAYANTYDVAALFSGDRDYLDAVCWTRMFGKEVEGYGFRSNTSQALCQACDRYTIMDAEFLEPYWL